MAGLDMAVPSRHRPQISVLGRFAVTVDGTELLLPSQAQRVLAYLSIDRAPPVAHSRSLLAERLWPGTPVPNAQASLRTALWRIRRGDPRLVEARADAIRIGAEVDVDLRATLAHADRLLAGGDPGHRGELRLESLLEDLLPGWDEDWLLLRRERLRQLRIHALEELSRRLCVERRFAQSIDVALAAIAAEPMRESSHLTLIAAYAAEGNMAAARLHFDRFRALLRAELAVAPSATSLAQFHHLVTRAPAG